MVHFSVTRFAPMSKRLIISMPLFLVSLLLLVGGNGVEAVVQNCGYTQYPNGGYCSCDTDTTAGTKVLLNCDGVFGPPHFL